MAKKVNEQLLCPQRRLFKTWTRNPPHLGGSNPQDLRDPARRIPPGPATAGGPGHRRDAPKSINVEGP